MSIILVDAGVSSTTAAIRLLETGQCTVESREELGQVVEIIRLLGVEKEAVTTIAKDLTPVEEGDGGKCINNGALTASTATATNILTAKKLTESLIK